MLANATLTLVIPSLGRPTLALTLRSLAGQPWGPGDEVLLVCDRPEAAPIVRELYPQFPTVPVRYMETPALGHWGHGVRNMVQRDRLVRTTHRAQLDDDDVWTPDALALIRTAIAADPDRPLIFRMDWRTIGGKVLWERPEVVEGNVGTPCLVAPVSLDGAEWGNRYTGDCDHIRGTCARHPLGPVWHEDVICVTRPHLGRSA
jgi:hypothetical protein